MTAERLVLEGEVYFPLEVVAECYSVEVTWLREACDEGLLIGVRVERTLAVRAADLDRVARLVRWRVVHGLDWPALAAVLD